MFHRPIRISPTGISWFYRPSRLVSFKVSEFPEKAITLLLSIAQMLYMNGRSRLSGEGYPVPVMGQLTHGAIIRFLVPLQVTVQLLGSATGFLLGTSGAGERLILRRWREAIIRDLRERRLRLVLLRGQSMSKVVILLRKSRFNHKQEENTSNPRKSQRAGKRDGVKWGRGNGTSPVRTKKETS